MEILRDRDGALTAALFTELVWRLARALEAQGLGRGDRVAMLVPNRRESLALRYAASAVGCASVSCPNRGPAALKAFVEQIAPALLIVFPQTAEAALTLPWPRASVGPVAGVELDVLAAAGEFPVDPFEVRARPEDLAYLVPSGGTTGLQKASRLTFATYERVIDAGQQPDRCQLVWIADTCTCADARWVRGPSVSRWVMPLDVEDALCAHPASVTRRHSRMWRPTALSRPSSFGNQGRGRMPPS